jgi:hypothetical protein
MRTLPEQLLALGTLLAAASALPAQPKARPNTDVLTKPFQFQAPSSISYGGGKDGEQTAEITNVAYELSADSLPGRPQGSRLVFRTATHSKQVVGDEGLESTVTIEAWPLGADLKQKPLYGVAVSGIGARRMDLLWLVDRSLEGDVSWWSLYTLGTGQHLFDTYVEPLRFGVSRADGSGRYAGLEVPGDDTADARLKEPHVIGVLSYASDEKVIREVLISSADAARAKALRSYADTIRTLTLEERPAGRSLRLTFENAYPSAPHTAVISVPIVKDDLDAGHAELAPGLRVAAWRR